jgi:hypothetical protein
MASIIAYLENYVESTIGLPSDLARFLNTIRVLDERAAEVEAALRQITEQLAAIKPVGTRAAAAEKTVSSNNSSSQSWHHGSLCLQACSQNSCHHGAQHIAMVHATQLQGLASYTSTSYTASPRHA